MTSDLTNVIESGMCIGCGACIAADPSISLVLKESSQSYVPSHPGSADAASVCPAIAVDFDFLQTRIFGDLQIGAHGVVDSVLLAQSTNSDRNLAASSGGLIKELMLAYLRSGEVDGIISLVHKKGIDFRAALVTDPESVDSLPGSIYHAVPFDDALKIIAERAGRYVLVAIPCQLEGIYTYIYKMAPHLADRIHATIGLLCGWQYTHHALRAICEYKGVDFDALTNVAWRGGGPVGKLKLTTPDRETAVSRRVDFSYQVAFDRSFNIPRCHLCINHSNFLSDIVVGDAWLPSTVYTATGISLIICRTPESRTLIDSLAKDGKIISTEVTVDEITESQTRRVVFGDFAYSFQDFLASAGLPHPVMTGPNRVEARLHDSLVAASFHRDLNIKLELKGKRRYRRLWWRKLTNELPRLVKRYLDWFLVRILRVKSLKGERAEVPRHQIRVFR